MKRSQTKKVFLSFVFASAILTASAQVQNSDAPKPKTDQFGNYTPNAGFTVAKTDKGSLNIKIFSYLRYLNQLGLDTSYTDAFNTTKDMDRRQDIQLNKVNVTFLGWLMDPKFRYIFYVWTNNTAQGQGAQVVVAGNLTYTINKHFTIGGGVNSLPGVRSTEGNFPFWLTVDNRSMSDEYFRPSYTMGVWMKGEVNDKLSYNIMLGNNLSQLGVDAGQLDAELKTISSSLVWHPTTGEYGLNDNFGDFENHQKVATRLAGHYSYSKEDRQGQPNTDAFENVALRVSDGSVIFSPNLFGSNIFINNATYNMACIDAGVKYKGFSFEGELYQRTINDFEGYGTENLAFNELKDNGFQLQLSGMAIQEKLQVYGMYSQINGEYGDPTEYRLGINWFPFKNHVVRWNFEYIQSDRSPVGGLSLPYVVGGTGSIFHSNFTVNF